MPSRAKLVIDDSMRDQAAAQLRAWLAQRDWPAIRDFLSTVADPDDRAFYVSTCDAYHNRPAPR